MFFWVKSPCGPVGTNDVSEKRAVSIFRAEDGDSTLASKLTSTNQSTRRLNPEQHHLTRHSRENLKPHTTEILAP
jgi:hypothetical protein